MQTPVRALVTDQDQVQAQGRGPERVRGQGLEREKDQGPVQVTGQQPAVRSPDV